MFSRAKALVWFLLFGAGCAGPADRGRAPDWPAQASAPRLPIAIAPEPGPPSAAVQQTEAKRDDADWAQNWVPLEPWCRQNSLLFAAQGQSDQGPQYRIKSASGALSLCSGLQVARWEGANVYLGFSPMLINGEPFVRELEIRKTLTPLLMPAQRHVPGTIIVLDPGHGGHDSGTRGALNGGYEKDFTLDWALRARAILLNAGFEVVLTRDTDTDLSIPERVIAADQCHACLFVSLHFNASGTGGEQTGVETYCLTPAGMPSSLTRGYEDDPTLAFPNNSFDSENLRLACDIHRSILRVNGNRDRGVRRARFLSVLRGQRRPAVLVEGGYLSNPAENRLISTPQHRQQLAEAIADALKRFLASPQLH